MNPDDYEPTEHTYREWEGEVTLDGVDYLVVGEPRVERFPVEKDGKLGTGYDYSFESLAVCTAIGDAWDQEHPLAGPALTKWREKYERMVAERACDEQQERALEARDW